MTEFAIRPAQPEDTAMIAALSIQVFLHTYYKDGISARLASHVLATFTQAVCLEEIASQPAWVAVNSEGKLLAYLLAAAEAKSEWGLEVERLYVAPAWQRLGIGRALLAAVRAQHARLWLTAWCGNANALAFYQREGWQRVGSAWFEVDGEKHENHLLAHSGATS